MGLPGFPLGRAFLAAFEDCSVNGVSWSHLGRLRMSLRGHSQQLGGCPDAVGADPSAWRSLADRGPLCPHARSAALNRDRHGGKNKLIPTQWWPSIAMHEINLPIKLPHVLSRLVRHVPSNLGKRYILSFGNSTSMQGNSFFVAIQNRHWPTLKAADRHGDPSG